VHTVAVIGLGRFGMTLARQLGNSGVEVIAMDRSSQLVDAVKEDVAIAVRLDSTDQEALISQKIQDVDICVVAIGENFEAALLTAVMVKRLGVPRLICRAQTAVHAEIFSRIGADEIIQPETQAGILLGQRLANPQVEHFLQLAEGFSLVEMRAPAAFRGKSLEQLGLRTKYHVNLVVLKRQVSEEVNGITVKKQRVISVPRPGDVIQEDDTLVLVGSHEALAGLPKE